MMMWVLRSLWRLTRSRLMIPILGIVVAGHCWMTFRPKPFPLDEHRSDLASEVAGKLAESLPVPPVGRPTLIVAPFERDPTGRLTEAVRRAIDRVDLYTVQPATFVENALRELGVRRELAPKAAASVALEDVDSEYLLAGRVEKLSARSERDEALLGAVLIPVGSPDAGIALTAEAVHDRTAKAQNSPVETYPWPARLVGWLALVLLLPMAFAPLATRGLEMQSNAVNLAMLLGLTLVAGLAAFAMLGFRLDTGISATLLVAAVAGTLAYNWAVLSKLEELNA